MVVCPSGRVRAVTNKFEFYSIIYYYLATGERLKEAVTMSTPAPTMQTLIEKIRTLPAERRAEVEDFIDFLKMRTRAKPPVSTRREQLGFPVISVGRWRGDASLRREDMYGDDGR